MGPEIVLPVGLFTTVILVVWLFQHFAARKRADTMETLRRAMEKGVPLTPETLESMARISSPIADLRRGIVFVAIAAGFATFATIVTAGRYDPEMQDVGRALYGVATFPLFVGLAFLGLHFFANESKRR